VVFDLTKFENYEEVFLLFRENYVATLNGIDRPNEHKKTKHES